MFIYFDISVSHFSVFYTKMTTFTFVAFIAEKHLWSSAHGFDTTHNDESGNFEVARKFRTLHNKFKTKQKIQHRKNSSKFNREILETNRSHS